MWAAKAAKIGYSWKVGNGESIRFWEDKWCGQASLATQFWDLYSIATEHNVTIQNVWDDIDLKINFRRCFSQDMMQSRNALFGCIKTIPLSDALDKLVWNYDARGIYSLSSFYKIVHFRGVIPGNGPIVWEVKIPPRVQIFIWLASNNKLLTRDNLSKR